MILDLVGIRGDQGQIRQIRKELGHVNALMLDHVSCQAKPG